MTPRLLGLALVCGVIALTGISATDVHAAQGAPATQSRSDQDGVRAAIAAYFRGHATADPAHFRQAFLPTAHIEGVRDGKFTSWTVDEYCALFKGVPASDENSRTRTIDLIDISGNSAMAKATLDHGATVFTDYLILLKVDGEWKIANKVYSGQRKAG